jgi:hypothetical protein
VRKLLASAKILLLGVLGVILLPVALVAILIGLGFLHTVQDALDDPVEAINDVKGTFKKPSPPPGGVSVCLHPKAGVFAGPLHCDADIGTAPIRPPVQLMCLTHIRPAKGELVGIQVFYRSKLILHGNVEGRGSIEYAWVVRKEIPGLLPGRALPPGRYRCRFLEGARVIHARAFTAA